MRVVWKFELKRTGFTTHEIPNGFKHLCTRLQEDKVIAYVECDPSEDKIKAHFYNATTGEDLSTKVPSFYKYIGTVQSQTEWGEYVIHTFGTI